MAEEKHSEVEVLRAQVRDLEARNSVLQKQVELIQQRYVSIATKMNKLVIKLQMLHEDANDLVNAQKALDEEINRKLRELTAPQPAQKRETNL